MKQREWLALGVIGGVTLLLSSPAPGIVTSILVLISVYVVARVVYRFTPSK